MLIKVNEKIIYMTGSTELQWPNDFEKLDLPIERCSETTFWLIVHLCSCSPHISMLDQLLLCNQFSHLKCKTRRN